MPVSEERVAQIRELSNDERIDRLDTSRFDGAAWQRLDVEMDEETVAFCRGNSDPEELHAFADTYNWDKGTWAHPEWGNIRKKPPSILRRVISWQVFSEKCCSKH
jgi:hypothetical protein